MSAVTEARPRAAVSLDSIRRAIEPTLASLAADASARDADRTRFDREIRELATAGILLARVHPDHGGAGGSYRDLVELIVDVARADSNVAQALRPSWLVADALAAPLPSDGAQAQELVTLRSRVLRGGLFAGTRNERGVPSGAVTTRLHGSADDGYVLDGTKFYSTGGVYADWFSGSAIDDSGEVVSVTVPTDRTGVEMVDDFDAVGQRLTASGTTRLAAVSVTDDEVARVDPGAEPTYNPLAQLHLAATLAGIAAAALDDAIAFAQHVARPIKHSTAARSVDDPYVRRTVGEISSRAFAARAAVVAAAEVLDDAVAVDTAAARIAATVAVAEAQMAAARASLEAGQLLFDVGSGSATLRIHGLDRHWRNARTVANHNPLDWKAAVVGAHRLTGEAPPTSGLF